MKQYIPEGLRKLVKHLRLKQTMSDTCIMLDRRMIVNRAFNIEKGTRLFNLLGNTRSTHDREEKVIVLLYAISTSKIVQR